MIALCFPFTPTSLARFDAFMYVGEFGRQRYGGGWRGFHF